jgi:hypothetical protein
LVTPRIVVPFAIAFAIAASGLGGHPISRLAAFPALALQAAAFLPLVLAIAWWTGDARQAVAWARGRFAGRAARTAVGAG